MTGMAAQWSHSTPIMSPIVQEHIGQYMHQVGQGQNGIGYTGAPGLFPSLVDSNGRFSQPAPCCNSGVNIVNALDSYSSRPVLMQMAMNAIQEFNSTNQEATIPWLDHIEGVAKKMGFDPLEIGMSKLKGTAHHDVNTPSKEGTLLYFWFCQLLIEHFSNITYALDALKAYTHLTQGENKLITQYLTRAKVLLKHIHHNSKMCNIQVLAMTNLTLFEDCAHHMSDEGLHLNRTPGIQWKMSFKQ